MNAATLIHRRELLRIGGVSVLAAVGGGAAALAAPSTASGASASPQAKRCIFMLLQGGPSHLDLWDPKPAAPVEVRGPYQTIETKLPGVRFGEMAPRTAGVADKIAIVRSMTHRFTNHIAGTYITLTGSTNQPDQDREAKGEDFPGPGAVLNYLNPGASKAPPSVSLPTWLSIPGPSNRMPGQYAGFLGAVRDPFLIQGDPNDKSFRPLALSLPGGFPQERMQARWGLLAALNAAARRLEDSSTSTNDHLRQSAYELLVDPKVAEALDLAREPDAVRDRYGRSKIGQSLLLARRLLEAGVQMVSYNAFNQEWDTHGDLFNRYKQIVPQMDQAYSALIEDLAQRGMLDDTLVINTGEFGRTPLINKDKGRDHWPNVYTALLAGGGIRGGQVYGASDKKGAQVASAGVSPADMLATMWHLLGVSPETELHDRLGRPQVLSRGRVVSEILG